MNVVVLKSSESLPVEAELQKQRVLPKQNEMFQKNTIVFLLYFNRCLKASHFINQPM